jgi:hypothetical protein
MAARTVNVPGGPLLSFVYDGAPHRYLLRADGETILVLSGRIRNDYSHPVARLRLRGTLLNSNRAVLSERRVPAGKLISESDLKTLPMAFILRQLRNAEWTAESGVPVVPGAEVPFMMVFDDLPPDLFEYVIDPVGWEPAR